MYIIIHCAKIMQSHRNTKKDFEFILEKWPVFLVYFE